MFSADQWVKHTTVASPTDRATTPIFIQLFNCNIVCESMDMMRGVMTNCRVNCTMPGSIINTSTCYFNFQNIQLSGLKLLTLDNPSTTSASFDTGNSLIHTGTLVNIRDFQLSNNSLSFQQHGDSMKY